MSNKLIKNNKPAKNKSSNETILIAVIGILFAICLIILIALGIRATFAASSGQFTAGSNTTGNNTTSSNTTSPSDTTAVESSTNPAADVTLNESVTYYADIEIEDYDIITIKLEPESAPITVNNFITLAKRGFYDGLTFHRIIEGFMMQGGDPNGNGTGGSENTITGEFTANGSNNTLTHTRGAVSMARSKNYNSASSQFFIVHEDAPHLNGEYAVFGYVTEGMDIVDAICESAEPTDRNGTIPAENQPVITSITIREE